MCILGQDGAVASTRDADMPRPDEWLTEAAPHRLKVGRLALDAPLVGAVATPNSHTPRSDTSLSSQAPTGTTTAHGGDSDFVETPRSEVGVPRAECCWQPTDVPGAGAPPAAVWCWQPVAFGQQHAGHAEGWQYGQPQPQALFCVGQFAAQFAAGAQLGAQQCEAFGGATPAPAQRRRRGGGRPAPAPRAPAADGPGGSGGGTSGKSEGGGGSAPQQGRQRAQRGVRSGKRPPPPPPPAFDAAWCEARLAELEGDAGARGGALAAVCGHALQLSFDKAGTRLVQRALEVAGREARDALLAEISGHAVEMMQSPHANYVAQKMFEVLPAEKLGAVIREFEGRAERVARHRYGCRILIQLFAHCLELPACAALVSVLLSRASEHCCHTYAHHVIEAILEHTHDDEHKRIICRALLANLGPIVGHYHGGHVLRAAFAHCSDADVRSLCGCLADRFAEVTATKVGCNLYRELCEHPRARLASLPALGPQHQ